MGVTLSCSLTQISQDKLANTTSVTVKIGLHYNSYSSADHYNLPGTCTIDGTAYGFSAGYNWYGYSSGDATIFTKTLDIPHEVSGAKVLTVSVSYQVGINEGRISGTWYFPLTTIPRASAISAEGGALGEGITILLTRADESYRDTVRWVCAEESGILAEKTDETELLWVPPVALAAQAPESVTVPITFSVTSFSGETELGTNTAELLCPIPEDVVPTAELRIEDLLGHGEKYGMPVAGRSTLRITADCRGALGSEIRSVQIKCGSLVSNTTPALFTLADSGEVQVSAAVTDSRGRTTLVRETLTAQSYIAPTVKLTALNRCSEQGELRPDGAFGMALFEAGAAALGGGNSMECTLQRRERGSVLWTDFPAGRWAGGYASEGSRRFPASIDRAYEVRIAVRDDFTEVFTPVSVLSAAYALLDFDRENRAAGILQRASAPGMLAVGADTKHFGHRITDVAAPTADTDAATAGWVKSGAKLTFRDVAAAGWQEIFSATDYGWTANITLDGVTADMYPIVTFAEQDAVAGALSPRCESYDGGVKIYAWYEPDPITIPAIVCWR